MRSRSTANLFVSRVSNGRSTRHCSHGTHIVSPDELDRNVERLRLLLVLDSRRAEALNRLGAHFYERHGLKRTIPFFPAATAWRSLPTRFVKRLGLLGHLLQRIRMAEQGP